MVTRIAILGGGAAALAAAYELTSVPGWESRYSIDLYQIGWRLGGKCASARNSKHRGRNEEHGLHILGGFYHNTFQQLRPLYEEWATCSKHPINFDDALFKHAAFTLMQRDPKDWREVRVHGPEDEREPGVCPEQITPAEMLRRVIAWLADALRGERLHDENLTIEERSQMNLIGGRMAALAEGMSPDPFTVPETEILELSTATQSLMARIAARGDVEMLTGIIGADWIGVIALLATIARGLTTDRVYKRGFDCINGYESEEWLRLHGGSDRAARCALFEAGYHYAFGYPNGGPKGNIAAGSGTRGLLRMVFGSHGSIFVHMNGGMGEVFVTPYYEVLKARGVNFHFFHRIEQLNPGADGRLASIDVRVQVKPKRGKTYDPLIAHPVEGGKKTRLSWPETPVAEGLQSLPPDPTVLESWEKSRNIGTKRTLVVGQDFDLCLLGLSIGTLREVAAPLAAAEPRWAEMLNAAITCPTVAAQIWREEEVSTFGGITKDGLQTAFERPLDTWADMSFLLKLETPSTQGDIKSLSYFCGPLSPSEAASDPHEVIEGWLQKWTHFALPGLSDGAGGYNHKGEIERSERFNTDPIDLFVDTPAGSVDSRLRPDGSGFSNLLLVGDWTRHNFDMGCVEAAVMSGRICSRAICGSPPVIHGESDFH